mmetsp:Transcript_5446/g.7921  ORF Transcript_5446/g.7921 Transcript_5446/m.7921 type:complete len:1195 (+) Transcript_5446:75-3659(+)
MPSQVKGKEQSRKRRLEKPPNTPSNASEKNHVDPEKENAPIDSKPDQVMTPNNSNSHKRKKKQSLRESIETPITPINHPGKPAEAGIIHKVSVENFMCHRKLTIQLCRNVNFIHGQNGSGKSAILAAIQICLGAGARRTHRARNLRDLVRKESASNGCAGAKVRVTLLNKGEDSFRHNDYGDYVTVERNISLGGGYNGYKLLDSNDQEKSRSKKDLDALLDQLNIQVENPVAVLDQEEAKKFLCGKPEDKYAFFTKATDLERIDRSYATVVDNIQELDETKARVQNNMRPAAENVKKLYAEWEEFRKMELLQDKVSALRVRYAWSVYWEIANKVKEEEERLNAIDSKLAKRVEDLEKAESSANVDDGREEDLKEKLKELTTEANEAAKHKSDLEEELRAAQKPIKEHQRAISSLKREILTAKRSVSQAVKLLNETREEIQKKTGNAASEEAKRTARREKIENQMIEAKENVAIFQDKVKQSYKKYEELEPAVEVAIDNSQKAMRQSEGLKRKLQELKRSEGNSLAIFGNRCATMKQKVEQAIRQRQFVGPVAGPIGSYLKVAPGKEHLATLAELSLGGGTLDRFVVTNDADRKLLMDFRKEVGCSTRECNVFQMKNTSGRYNVKSPPRGVDTAETVLNVTDDLVYNSLIDNCKIDQIALTESKESSEELLLIKENGGKYSIREGNIKQVYFLPKGDFWLLSRGQQSMTSTDRKLKQTIGLDRSEAIGEAEEELNQLLDEIKSLRANETERKEEKYQCKVEWNDAKKSLEKTQIQIKNFENTIEEIKTEAEMAENFFHIDTADLEHDVKEAEDKLTALKVQVEENENAIEEIKPEMEEVRNRLEETKARNEKVLFDIGESEKKLEEYMRSMKEKSRSLSKKREKVKQAEETRAKQEELLSSRNESKAEALLKARLVDYNNSKAKEEKERKEQHGEDEGETDVNSLLGGEKKENIDVELDSIEPKSTDKDPSYYKSKVQRAENEIEKERKKRRLTERDPEVALQKYQRAKKDLDTKMKQLDKIEDNITALVKDVKDRKKLWKQFRSHIDSMTNEIFDEMLNKKGSSGQIEFNHREKQLNLIVQKDNRNEQSQTKDVKALSGGERSFTTLSLLLALGENLETPFRVMDEFDVFLDAVSRKIALDTMISVAKQIQHRQFIFITPQDLSNIPTDPMLKIFHLKPPERLNRVGGPSQQTL